MKPLTFAIVGCGNFTFGALPHMIAAPDWKCVGLADPDAERLEEKRQAAGLPTEAAHTTEDSLYASIRPDVVFVHSPVGIHYANAKRALEAGCNVCVQKPFVEDLATGQDLVRRAAEAGKWVSVNQTSRFGATPRLIAKLLADGRIGTPRFGHWVQYRNRMKGRNKYQYKERWSVLIATAIHQFDCYRFWFGGRIKRVQFRGIDVDWNPYPDPGAATGWLETESGMVMTFLESFVSPICLDNAHHPYAQSMIQGSEGALHWAGPWGNGPIDVLRGDAEKPERIDPEQAGFEGIMEGMMKAIARTCRDEGPVVCPAEDNLWSLATCMAAQMSAAQGGHPVDVLELGRVAGLPEPTENK